MLLLGVNAAKYESQRVLVVDDRDDIRALLLARFGLTYDLNVVGEAADGHSAVQMVTALKPDSVVLDLDIPLIRGEDAIPLIRAASPRTKIIVYTGSSSVAMAGLYNRTAADAFVCKGGRLDTLVATMRDLTRLNTLQSGCRVEV